MVSGVHGFETCDGFERTFVASGLRWFEGRALCPELVEALSKEP